MISNTRGMLRLVTVLTAAVFIFSAILNFGVKIPVGFFDLSFSNPLLSTGIDEIVIGLLLVAAAVVSRLYVYGATYFLALIGIAFGLTSPLVQGFARNLHAIMLPLAIFGWILIVLDVRISNKTATSNSGKTRYREVITILQFFVAALVVIGGIGFAVGGTYPLGTALGLIHLFVGLMGLFGGYSFLRKKIWSRDFLIAVNSLTLVYSAFSEGMAQIYSLLPPGINDSLVGTIIAIIVSGAIICLLLLKPNA